MRSLSRALVITALAVSLPATLVLAQGDSTSTDTAAMGTRHERLLDGKFALVKATLKLDDAQMKLWTPVEEQIRATQSKRAEMRKQWREKRKERRAERSAENAPKERKHASLPERLERRGERLTQRAERIKKFAEVLKPFYESLNDDQKSLVGPVMREFRIAGMSGHDRRGRRWDNRGWGRH